MQFSRAALAHRVRVKNPDGEGETTTDDGDVVNTLENIQRTIPGPRDDDYNRTD